MVDFCKSSFCISDREFGSKYCAKCDAARKSKKRSECESRKLIETIANLNPEAGEIGAGMLANIVDKARKILKAQGIEQ